METSNKNNQRTSDDDAKNLPFIENSLEVESVGKIRDVRVYAICCALVVLYKVYYLDM